MRHRKDGKDRAPRVKDDVNVLLTGSAHRQLRIVNVRVTCCHRHALYLIRASHQPAASQALLPRLAEMGCAAEGAPAEHPMAGRGVPA
eukprot:CAMPEP_0173399474 /NCGR_PEP_ID=MMETSP1356-20130122/45017_1 /TAXON_ID=77927 ORGANISM="Hemiselmis virescens, Strain PCC157" /NCGR_SAMPLE_ID=MMETSP1356 /ASSEMBLY_ACC=CAM_ASM_000847 /LENGTH=87 /DNA_ID=CAMNT_0014359197 /DNA_START=13 /DNA_END=272 /DNA_ORIENTATION=-